MKSKPVRTLLPLIILSLGVVLNTFGRPPIPSAPSRPVESSPPTMLNGAAQVQAESMVPDPAMLTKTTATNTFEVPSEPQMLLGTNTLVTGLMVDCLAPKQTWKMLNPPTEKKNLPAPAAARPVAAPTAFNNNLAVHESDFALIRFNFGSSPRPTKPQP